MRKKEEAVGAMLALPVLLGTLVFFLAPFGVTVWKSLTFGPGGTFAGLDTYAAILRSTAFRLSVWNILRFALLCVPLLMAVSLLLALPMRKNLAGAALFRRAFLLPLLLPAVSILPAIIPLADRAAFFVLAGIYLWKNFGLCLLLFLVGLRQIPDEIFESARLEGASSLQIFVRITLPLLRPMLLFVAVLGVMNCFGVYREALLLGGAHPDPSIYLLQHFLNNNFQNLNLSRLSAAAVLSFLFFAALFGIVIFLWKRGRRDA